jgi:hypothetical protein
MIRLKTLSVVLLLLAAAGGWQLTLAGKAKRLVRSEASFYDLEIVAAKSMPPQFQIVLTRDMPTAGWNLEVDALEVDEEARRIVARISERGPQGVSAQVVTPAKLHLEVGTLDSGPWLLEIRSRRSAEGPYGLVFAELLAAY